jgi:hypothetical protein
MLKYLKKKRIDYYMIIEQRYNNMSIVDRFIRILLDTMMENKPISNANISRLLRLTTGNISNNMSMTAHWEGDKMALKCGP